MGTLLSINNYNYCRGGAETVFLAHNEIFRSHQWQVALFCMQHEKNEPSEWDDYFVEEIEKDSSYGPLRGLAKSLKAIYSWEAKKKIERLVDEIAPDIAHGHNIYHHISPAILSSLKKKSIPTVLTLHDLKIACPAYQMQNQDGICERCKGGKYYNATLHRCMHGSTALSAWVSLEAYVHAALKSYGRFVDRFVVPSHFHINKFVEWGWDRQRFEYIPNFVDANAIKPCEEAGTGFVFVGRLSREKGLETLIRASALSGEAVKILGTGPDEGKLRELADDLGAPAEFVGFVSGDALFDRLREARALILPSECYENAPISILEAYAAGTPVIGSEIGGIPELIVPERGRTFEAFSVTALADAMADLSSLPDRDVREMGLAAREYVEKTHSIEAYYQKCRDLYASLLN
jgi:glycosyltransferase involved in cell wall biosynthesis